MKVIVQRSKNSSVKVNNKIVGEIDFGLVILVGFTKEDNLDKINQMVNKIINLRIFNDENGIMNKNILDIEGKILSISQFTLYANTKKGNRPSYVDALNKEEATILYDRFNEELRKYLKVETGIFHTDMEVNIINDGPVTIILEN
ncbi:MAG TPA: D-aminoacyl-tRNA deacylase [Bacilli bacterium]|nr:D-aminoacyl-tRNA deacylase [Bacilli bacterium]